MIRLVLSIRSLDIGGAERQFIELVKHIDKTKFDVIVCTMYGGVQEDIVRNIPNITYYNLQKKGRYDFIDFYKKYKRLLLEINPDVIYSFLGEMNLFSLWCNPKKIKLIWGFRASNKDLKKYGIVPQILFWLQKILSSKVDKIITNSNASIDFHKKEDFFMDSATVIYNGIDTNRYKKNEFKRKNFRQKYGLKGNDIAIGIVARIDYIKGYDILVKSAKKLLTKYNNLKFFSIGREDTAIKKECEEVLGEFNNISFIWMGERKQIEDFYSGFDILVSASFSEGFGNSIAEAMSCEIPCVVTDVGDSRVIVGECGIVVKPNSAKELSIGVDKLIKKDLKKIGICSRERIVKNFSIEKMVKKTEEEILKCVE